ncbi:hypothetical protein PBPRB1105 [Photobacterium profundum SS9]|uniref:Uncharacterized protein n=1 Tax=Photobacterium profundum (strain SS9) TaxID=298386 RepID=Q6LIA3_PHOPR|nr:hypothetical protein PBPRB1105 [Photobacterium profundum SS9]
MCCIALFRQVYSTIVFSFFTYEHDPQQKPGSPCFPFFFASSCVASVFEAVACEDASTPTFSCSALLSSFLKIFLNDKPIITSSI